MGARANYFLIRDGTRRTFYSQWGAEHLAFDMFWGEQYAIPFVEQQLEVDDEYLLGDEGGAVIDIDHHVVLLFASFVGDDIPLRRLYLRLMQVLWTGWEVRWAPAHQLDLVDYVGLSREILTAGPPAVPETTFLGDPLDVPEHPEFVDTVVSVRLRGGELRLYPISRWDWVSVDSSPFSPLPVSRLLAAAHPRPGSDRVTWSEWNDKFPEFGIHLDEGTQHGLWWAARTEYPPCSIDGLPGWRLDAFGDRFEAQLAETGDALRLPQRTDKELVKKLRGILNVGRSPLAYRREKRLFNAALETAGVK
jgi:hypothetical protein